MSFRYKALQKLIQLDDTYQYILEVIEQYCSAQNVAEIDLNMED